MAPSLGRLALPLSAELTEALEGFDCVGDRHGDDKVAADVCAFLRSHGYRSGIEHGFSATCLYIDPDLEKQIIGYVTLTLSEVRLTNTERRAFGDVPFSGFGAVKIAMIGVDCEYQRSGYGAMILEAVTEISRRFEATVPARFLLADANVRQVKWYEARGFVPNEAKREKERGSGRTVSMRLDLTPPPATAAAAIAA
jgi:ribosomal protein S18 acetylase RimI-like enzyme